MAQSWRGFACPVTAFAPGTVFDNPAGCKPLGINLPFQHFKVFDSPFLFPLLHASIYASAVS